MKTRIKEALLTECNLHTIVRLPNGVFNPYTGIRTNLLFFTKAHRPPEVWYYEHPYPPGAKRVTTRASRFASRSSRASGRGGARRAMDLRRVWKRAGLAGVHRYDQGGGFNLDLKNSMPTRMPDREMWSTCCRSMKNCSPRSPPLAPH